MINARQEGIVKYSSLGYQNDPIDEKWLKLDSKKCPFWLKVNFATLNFQTITKKDEGHYNEDMRVQLDTAKETTAYHG
jgi:predicted aminopeptidase